MPGDHDPSEARVEAAHALLVEALAFDVAGRSHDELDRHAEALAVRDEIVARYSDLPEARDAVLIAMIDKGCALGGTG
jgi:hypothetical protein